MPQYVYRCDECKIETTDNVPMDERDALVGRPAHACGEGCSGLWKRVFTPYAVIGVRGDL